MIKRRTFKGREAAIEQKLEIAEVPLGEGDGGEAVGLGGKLGPAGLVAGDEVLEDTAVGSERHLDKGLSAESLERGSAANSTRRVLVREVCGPVGKGREEDRG